MSNGIKLVWAGWFEVDGEKGVVGFSNRGRKHWESALQPGVTMLLYETGTKTPGYKGKSTKSVVGEVRVAGSFDEGETMRTEGEEHAHLLPVAVTRAKADCAPVPLDKVREIIGDESWPKRGQSFTPLDEAQYAKIVEALGGS